MNKEELLEKVKLYLDNEYVETDACCEKLFKEWIHAVFLFREKTQKDCCLKALRSVQHYILEESNSSHYIVRKNAMFGDLKEIRRGGFEKRYQHNIRITKTYIAAYIKTENEYISMFGKRRYSSYDSFRNVRNRLAKKK